MGSKSKLVWYVNRLKAMNLQELSWRVSQKQLKNVEKQFFASNPQGVFKSIYNSKLLDFSFRADALGLNFFNNSYSLNETIHLLGGFKYNEYSRKWHSGFQTSNNWSLTFSYQLTYKQRDDIGDARTNWELNRHFQFALLAKNYYASGNEKYLAELKSLFDDWNKYNPFLFGISWTSVMEIAIRAISWMYTLAFLRKKGVDSELLSHLHNGIMNMIDYVVAHYSRFSSANNHLLVEATAIGLAGYAYNNAEWKETAMHILSEELYKQNYEDGVNKELSLHYHTFVMEAYALMMHTMQAHGDTPPVEWLTMLGQMSEYVSHSLWKEQIACEFGDNDEGKIVDLAGGEYLDYYGYVLQLCSLVLRKRYHSFNVLNETICWLYTQTEIDDICQQPCYDNSLSRCFKIGGNSFLRSTDGRILISVDHAELGFGAIAAHGHADALSFQMFVDGKRLFSDPGTYIYHCQLEERNKFRQTLSHNTLCLNGKDQSEMLGPFLWGKRANCKLLTFNSTDSEDVLLASHDGYNPVIHQRKFYFKKQENTLVITDELSSVDDYICTYIVGNDFIVEKEKENVYIKSEDIVCHLAVESKSPYGIIVGTMESSTIYGLKYINPVIRIKGTGDKVSTYISINDRR